MPYPQKQKTITQKQIEKIVSYVHIDSLKPKEAIMVREAILNERGSDMKISLDQIYRALTKLKNQYLISEVDRRNIMEKFEEYFAQ
ncbi:MAG: hypothetical protein ABH832_02490 [bacterium]